MGFGQDVGHPHPTADQPTEPSLKPNGSLLFMDELCFVLDNRLYGYYNEKPTQELFLESFILMVAVMVLLDL